MAQAILGSPALILLDEPTDALDKDGIEQVAGLIRELKEGGSTIVIASHDRVFLDSLAMRS